jgi:hypothetical protein
VPEVLLRFGVRDQDRARIEAFSKMLPAVILSGPPGVAVTGGRPQAQEVVAYWPALLPRDLVRPTLVTAAGERTLDWPTPLVDMGKPAPLAPDLWPQARPADEGAEPDAAITVRLSELAHARSGDKGDMANIGLIARSPELYPWLAATLTAEVVKQRFTGICHGEVTRHEVPNLWALNFLLDRSLGGGGTVSLRLDAQGKTLSHALLAMEVTVPRALLEAARDGDDAYRAGQGLPKLRRPKGRATTRRAPARKPSTRKPAGES